MHAQRRLVVAECGAFATERLQVEQVSPSRLPHVEALDDRGCSALALDHAPERGFGLRLRQADVGAGLPRRSELSHHLPAARDSELPVVRMAARAVAPLDE